MHDAKNTQHQALIDFHKKIAATLPEFETLTKESIAEALAVIPRLKDVSIIPFTGYYALKAPAGAFLSIDALQAYFRLTQRITVEAASASITVSMDGKASTTYPNPEFDGRTLTIPGVLSVELTRKYQDGILTTLSGTINGVDVMGYNRFNPVPLSTFIGNYYLAPPSLKNVLSITDSSILFDFGAGLREVKFYTYIPLMFVLILSNPNSKQEQYSLMMGTSGSQGLASYILSASGGEFAFTIPG